MKKIFTIVVTVLVLASVFLPPRASAQSPEKMSYQAVIRGADDNLLTDTQVGIQISILQGSANGTAVYIETQEPTTNANGLVSIEIGAGTVESGDFSTIDWANGPYFIKTETDPAGGVNYTITGTSQLLSVPYALHAKTATTVTGGITETDPAFTGSQAANITAADITKLNNLSGKNTGDQNLSALATKTALGDSIAQIRSEIPNVNGIVETDPVYGSSVASGITETDTTNWNNKLNSETDPAFSAWDKSTGISITESQISDLNHFTTADETDPVYGSSVASGITETDTTNWNNKLNSETDPAFSAWDKSTGISITESQISDLNHFTTADETDPVYGLSIASGITGTDTTNWNNKQDQLVAGTNITIVGNTISATGSGSSNNFYLGQDTLEGIVFYIYLDANDNQHGLIVSKTETTAKWQNTAVTTSATRSWDGVYNMNLMSESPAKDWVTGNFSTDWYLPSIDELAILWHNRFHVNKALNDAGATLLANTGSYWSSTEYSAADAFGFYFANGVTSNFYKTSTYSVRAVRAF